MAAPFRVLFAAAAMIAGGLAPCATASPLSEPPDNFEIHPDGTFTWEGAAWAVTSFDKNWLSVKQSALNPMPGENLTDEGFVDDGKWNFLVSGLVPAVGSRGDRVWTLNEHVRRLNDSTLGVNYRVRFPDKVDGEVVVLHVAIPIGDGAGRSAEFDGESVVLPEAQGENPVLFSGRVQTATIPVAGGALALKCSANVQLQDDRRWGYDTFSLRIYFDRATSEGDAAPAIDYSLWVSAKFIPH